jgi:ABC-2 type transport system ATP-binding protein
MHLVRLDRLTRYYGDLLAFQAEEMELAPGAIGLLGPNGAGKSTFIQMLLGLLPPSSGRAEVFGIDVARDPVSIRARVGYLSESEVLVPGLKVIELVALAGEVCGLPRRDAHRRAHEVLGYLGVEESRYRRGEELSTGMKQRVQLAQALVHDPELLILDEPTNGLDPVGRRAMLNLIASLHRDFKKSVILSSHVLEDVDRVCESVVILDRGRVLAQGRIDVLRAHRRNRYRLRLRGDPARFLERLRSAGVEAEGGELRGEETGLIAEAPEGFAPRRFFEILAETNGAAPDAAGGAVLCELLPDEERLEDLFRRVVAEGGRDAG